ncbi:hypothetical protein CP967_03425 [Streptomyces nitrosporeus]|uniref:Uncharacterized protein n=1 Tax=Streptomyces nitrosporeus TaxID=28894 RepID=A0A5J6F4T6_9ACTN|nr:hypothetical protein [Streptomyces nitrosporeus]QEU71132.1 hypothetical protein CP967_03425 [Streptomyces nitrosporeus]
MTVSPDPSVTAHRTAALCSLLGSPEDLRHPGVRENAERARDLVRGGAGADELTECFGVLDHVLRQAGAAGGLLNASRGATARGVAAHIKVAVCPGPVPCNRLERARDLLPAPLCAVHGARMRKSRLGPGR